MTETKAKPTIDAYLRELGQALHGSDPALIQDALSDAEEYLANEVQAYHRANPSADARDALRQVIDKYGSAREVAEAYRDAEVRGPVAVPSVRPPRPPSLVRRFFGVFADPRTYGSLFYMFFSLATGIFYFTWVVTGVSLSLGLIVLIIGLPLLGLFLASVKGLAAIEGRLVEALLGERMPRRPIFTRKGKGFFAQLKGWLADGHTWTTLIYLALMLPLGVFYFSLFTSLLATSLALVAAPILHYGFDLPVMQISNTEYYFPDWSLPLISLGGLLFLVLTLHLGRGIGLLHARLAKGMLVKNPP